MRTVIAVMAVLACAASVRAQESNLPAIVTTGQALVRRAPDVAFVGVSVETRAKTSRDAQSANSETANAVLKRISDLGIPKDALKTTSLRVEQEFDYNNGRRTPRGYVARNTVEVRVDDVTKAGEVADAAVQAGATSIEGIRFDLKDRANAEREALRLAVVDARGRAEAIAAGAGRNLGNILKIEESRLGGPEPRPMARMSAEAAAPVEPGFIDVRALVTLTVSIR